MSKTKSDLLKIHHNSDNDPGQITYYYDMESIANRV